MIWANFPPSWPLFTGLLGLHRLETVGRQWPRLAQSLEAVVYECPALSGRNSTWELPPATTLHWQPLIQSCVGPFLPGLGAHPNILSRTPQPPSLRRPWHSSRGLGKCKQTTYCICASQRLLFALAGLFPSCLFGGPGRMCMRVEVGGRHR